VFFLNRYCSKTPLKIFFQLHRSKPEVTASQQQQPLHLNQQTMLGLEGIVSNRKDSQYRSGRSPHWIKSKNPNAPAVKREAEEDWGKIAIGCRSAFGVHRWTMTTSLNKRIQWNPIPIRRERSMWSDGSRCCATSSNIRALNRCTTGDSRFRCRPCLAPWVSTFRFGWGLEWSVFGLPQREFANQKALLAYAERNALVYAWERSPAFAKRQRLLSPKEYEIVEVRTSRGMSRAMLFSQAILLAEWEANAPLREAMAIKSERWRVKRAEEKARGRARAKQRSRGLGASRR
jgi:hypothetical protein